MKRYEGVITARQGASLVDITTETLTYDIEAWAEDGSGSVRLTAATPNRPWRNVEVTSASEGDPAFVWLGDDGRSIVWCPTESVDFGECDGGAP
jgi:hypothetical protein